MQKSDDISALYDQFGGNPDNFREIGRADRTHSARSRWPLFAHLAREQGVTVPSALDHSAPSDTRIPNAAPHAQPDRETLSSSAPQHNIFKASAPQPIVDRTRAPVDEPAHQPVPAPAPEPSFRASPNDDLASVWSIRGSPSSTAPARHANPSELRVPQEKTPAQPAAQETRREPSWRLPPASPAPKPAATSRAAPKPAPAHVTAPTPAPEPPTALASARFAAPPAAARLAGASPLSRLARPEQSGTAQREDSRSAEPSKDDLATVFARLADNRHGGEHHR